VEDEDAAIFAIPYFILGLAEESASIWLGPGPANLTPPLGAISSYSRSL